MNPALSRDIFRCLFPFFPEGLLENDLLRLVRSFGSTALCPVRAAAAVLASLLGVGHNMSIPNLCGLPSQLQLSALYAGKAIFFGVLFHILNSSHLLLKFSFLFLVVVGGLYEAHLARYR